MLPSHRAIFCSQSAPTIPLFQIMITSTDSPNKLTSACDRAAGLVSEGNLAEALDLYESLLREFPGVPRILHGLGVVTHLTGDSIRGGAYIREALERKPDYADAWNNLGNVLKESGSRQDAIQAYRTAVKLKPSLMSAWYSLGVCYKDQERLRDAARCLKRALALEPNNGVARYLLGQIQRDRHHLAEAYTAFRRVLTINPAHSEAALDLGNVLIDRKLIRAGLFWYQKAIELQPALSLIRSNVLACLQYLPEFNDEEIFLKHCEWQTHLPFPVATSRPEPVLSVCGKIRIGYVSPDLCNHPVGVFLSSVIPYHDRNRFEIICYSDGAAEDHVTKLLKLHADVWRDVQEMTRDDLAQCIRSDSIGILIDLAGHTAKNRLEVFAMGPAPVQATWAGYVGTTGLSVMDYLISDHRQSPPGSESLCVEKIVRLPFCYVPFTPPEYAPPVGPLPALSLGHVSFGCCNNLVKINDRVTRLWAGILLNCRGSRLILKTPLLADRGMRAKIKATFSIMGIEEGRLDLRGPSDHIEMLKTYHDIDIALDPFPYSGGLTTLEALWMGTPVVTLRGTRFCSLHSTSHLTAVGLSEYIADTEDEYLRIALELASDLPRLAGLRSGLREQVAASPLLDSHLFTRHLEVAYREMWRRSRSGEPPTSFDVSADLSKDPEEIRRQGLREMSKNNIPVAETLFLRALVAMPDDPALLNDLGIVSASRGHVSESMEFFRHAVRMAPEFCQARMNLGKVMVDENRLEEGEELLESVLVLRPDDPETLNNLAHLRRKQGRVNEAVALVRRVVTVSPKFYLGWVNLGFMLAETGDAEGALSAVESAAALDSTRHEAYSNIFVFMHYRDRFTQADHYQRSLEWGSRFPVLPLSPVAQHGVILRIGFVSADFVAHTVGVYLAALLEHLDRDRFQVYCYNNSPRAAGFTSRIENNGVEWRDIAGIPDQEVVEVIRRDAIQILVDLSGHTAGNRLPLFALRPAPVQATWLGYFNTTGLSAIDWIIMDHWSVFPGEDQWFAEKVYQLPDCRFCYTPPRQAPDVDAPPAMRKGYVTFGCFNNPLKYSQTVLQAWSEILRRVPASKIILKAGLFDDHEMVQNFKNRFVALGIDPERVDLRGKSAHHEMLQEYGDIDIVLDPFPFNGGLTTCEALWMGVPVVTVSADTPVSRQGRSFLSLIGLTELVADTVGEYIRISVRLADDLPRLAQLRSEIRRRMSASPLCDGVGFTRNLEKALHDMWEQRDLAEKDISLEPGEERRRRVLNVGGNDRNIPISKWYDGWDKHVLDIDPAVQPDILCDARQLEVTVTAGEYDAVYCSHNLEHYYRHDSAAVLRGFRHVLKQDGFVEIRVPDLPSVINTMTERGLDLDDVLYKTGSGASITAHDVIYGWQRKIEESGSEFFAHKGGFSQSILLKMLEEAGFPWRYCSVANLEVHCIAFSQKPSSFLQELLFLTSMTAHLPGLTTLSQQKCTAEDVLEYWGESDELIEVAEGFIQSGMATEAISCLEKALPSLPDSSKLHRLLGTSQAMCGMLSEAEQNLEAAIEIDPSDAASYQELGNLMRMTGKLDDADAYYRLSLEINDRPECRLLLIQLLREFGRLSDAESECRLFLQNDPVNSVVLSLLGDILLAGMRYDEAEDLCRRAVLADSLSVKAHYTLGKVLSFRGQLDEALTLFCRALELDKTCAAVHSAIIFIMNYLPTSTGIDILVEGNRWWQMHGASRYSQAPPLEDVDIDPDRVLRIGYLSPDFGRHPVGFFLAGVLPSHDRSRFTVTCFSDRFKEDELTKHLQNTADRWLVTAGYSDETLFRIIREERIDILIDLAGHCGRNRLTLFAMRPAPVQVTWAGYVGTTGLKTMDYLISDWQESPQWADSHACEKIYRLPDVYVCWHPAPYSPDLAPLPARVTGIVTFGCFNTAVKLNKEVVKLWAKILERVPESRLLLKTREFADQQRRELINGYFQESGIAPGRLILEEGSSHVGMLKAYARVDVALDPFPYSGGITTLEALWMGVPVVTLPGERFCSRHTLTHLNAVGLSSCVAATPDEYVEIAVQLAGDLAMLTTLRRGLRERMKHSPLLDATTFTSNLEDGFRWMWQNYLKPGSVLVTDSSNKPAEQLNLSFIASSVDSDVLFEQARELFTKKEFDAAEAIYHQILKANPDHPRALHALGVIAHWKGDDQRAIEMIFRAVEIQPDFVGAYHNLGNVQVEASLYGQAEQNYRKALELDPSQAQTLNSLGNVCLKTGRIVEARELYLRSLSLIQDPMIQSNLLMSLEYDDTFSDDEIKQLHVEWEKFYGNSDGSVPTYPQRKTFTEKVLRIGYVSGDFGRHPVGFNLMQVLPNHDRGRFKVYCYSNRIKPDDDYTESFRVVSDCWRDIHEITDAEVADIIRKDRIDILVDLSGHTSRGRLAVFCSRPAPVQVSWLGYWNTTGLSTVDYVINDEIILTPEYSNFFVEKPLLLPASRFCFTPRNDAPAPGAPPYLTQGDMTFGCFANPAKISQHTISAWSRIMAALPESRLILKNRPFSDHETIMRFREAFDRQGVDSSRIDFRGESGYLELFDEYQHIDIALDTFPFSGGATSFDALWMGVPVVTLAGRRPSGRQTLAFLKMIGLDDLVAESVDGYVELAVNLAHDRSKLAKLRAELRPRLAVSDLCDGKKFTSDLEQLYRWIWSEWCENKVNKMKD